MIDFRVLGAVDIRVRGGAALHSVLSQPKRTALFTYLLLARPRRFHRRDQLVALFWPEADAEHGRNSLRQAVHFLRRSLGDGVVQARGEEELGVAEDACWSDVAEFEDALDRGEPEAALALYGGELLPGLHAEGTPEFERWLDGERARLRGRAVRAAAEASTARERAGDVAGAVALGARALALAPGDQALLRRQMQLLERSGDLAGALACYEAHAKRLLVDYELEPAAETRALADQIRAMHNLQGHVTQPQAAALAQAAEPLQARSPAANQASVAPPVEDDLSPVASAARTPRRSRRGIALGAVVLAGACIGASAWLSIPRGVVREGAEVIVAQAVNRTSLPSDRDLGEVLTEALRTDLQQSGQAHVLGPEETSNILEFMRIHRDTRLDAATARQVALRTGAEIVVESSIGSAGDGYVLTADLVAPQSGTTLASVSVTASATGQLVDAIDRLSRGIRRKLGTSLVQVWITPPLSQVSTPSLEAFRKYTQAQREWQAGEPGYVERFENVMLEAVAIDTSFGMAYARLGLHLYNQGRKLHEAARYLARAYELRDRMTERERSRITALYYRVVAGDRSRAIAAYHGLLQLSGSDSAGAGALEHLAILYSDDHVYDRAEEYARRRVALVRPLSPRNAAGSYPLWRLAKVLAAQGKYQEVLQVALGLDSVQVPGGDELRFNVAYDLHGVRAADTLLRRYAAPDSARLSLPRAFLALVQGQVAAAERTYPFDSLELAGIDMFIRQDPRAARLKVRSLVEKRRRGDLSAFDMPYDTLVDLLSRTGDVEAARALLRDFDTAVPPALRNVARAAQWIERPRGELAFAEGRFGDAIRHFKLADSLAPCVRCMMPMLGRAYEAAGYPDSAAAAYEKYVSRTDLHELDDDVYWLPFVIERLAALRERRGDPGGAAACYARFAALWQNADEELQPRVRSARARLAALGADSPVRRLQALRRGCP